MDRFAVREQIERDLASAGLLEKVEAYTNNVGYSERTSVCHRAEAVDAVVSEDGRAVQSPHCRPLCRTTSVRLVPSKFKNVYRHWMEQRASDWCISRQLWWGQPHSGLLFPDGRLRRGRNSPSRRWSWPVRKDRQSESLSLHELRQDPDVLDTWFSSWLWPISVFDGINRPR